MIRGAVAFGLVLRIPFTVKNRSVIVTTSLTLVVFTTIVLGCTVATIQKILFSSEMKEVNEQKKKKKGEKGGEHEMFMHPNLDTSN